MPRLFLFLILLTTASCASKLERPATPEGELIKVRYSPGYFICSPCESLEIVMTSSGEATWIYGHGTYERWIEERHRIPFSPEHFRAWKARIDVFRPARNRNIGEDEAADADNVGCAAGETHSPSRTISWESMNSEVWLALDLRCDPEKYADLHRFFADFPKDIGVKLEIATSHFVTNQLGE